MTYSFPRNLPLFVIRSGLDKQTAEIGKISLVNHQYQHL